MAHEAGVVPTGLASHSVRHRCVEYSASAVRAGSHGTDHCKEKPVGTE
jgi:hypothetical protein